MLLNDKNEKNKCWGRRRAWTEEVHEETFEGFESILNFDCGDGYVTA